MKMTANVYLSFCGNCEEAFLFYKSVFNKEFSHISYFRDMPPSEGYEVAEEEKDKLLHVSLPISDEAVIMGSDCAKEQIPYMKEGNNFSISLNVDSENEAKRLFEALKEGGQVIMPLEKTFWAELFGMITDKFGINWMVNLEK